MTQVELVLLSLPVLGMVIALVAFKVIKAGLADDYRRIKSAAEKSHSS